MCAFPLACIFELPFDAPAASVSANIVYSVRWRLAAGCGIDIFREAKASVDPVKGSGRSSPSAEARLLLPKTCLVFGTVEELEPESDSSSNGSDGSGTSLASGFVGLGAERTVLNGS